MATTTDAAREIADLGYALHSVDASVGGALALAGKFNVPAWSSEFYQIIFTISRRIDGLKALISSLEDIDQDLRQAAGSHLDQVSQAFSQNGLNNAWSHSVKNFISAENLGPIRMLSPMVRAAQSYPKLDETEMGELIEVVDELLSWLRDHQINEQDFIRQAIIEGLEGFRFRAQRVQWIGWGYTVESLREVIGAYLALERGLDQRSAPDAAALLKKVESGLKWIFDKIDVVKDGSEKAGWLLESYKNISGLAIAAKGGMLLLGHG